MAKHLAITIFCEDSGHERFVRALVHRLAAEERVQAALEVLNATGGKGKAVSSLKTYQLLRRRGPILSPSDLLVIVIDSNSAGWHEKRREIEAVVDEDMWPACVIGCPDPHIERWCFADADAFRQVVGLPPPVVRAAGGRGDYKAAFQAVVDQSACFVLGGAMDLAPEIVAAMDWAAAEGDRSLKDFIHQLRGAMRRWGSG